MHRDAMIGQALLHFRDRCLGLPHDQMQGIAEDGRVEHRRSGLQSLYRRAQGRALYQKQLAAHGSLFEF
jgi:hypothetical protein